MPADLPHPAVAWRRALFAAELDPTAKLVGLALAQHMDGAGRAQVSRSTLAGACGFTSVAPVLRAVQRLELAGLLGVDRAKGGQQSANRYQARNGTWPDTVGGLNGTPLDTVEGGQRYPSSTPTVSQESHELEGLEGQKRARAAREVEPAVADRPYWHQAAAEDPDAELIAATFAQREAQRLAPEPLVPGQLSVEQNLANVQAAKADLLRRLGR